MLAQAGKSPADASEREVSELATWVYEYAYPLASMDATMRQATSVSNASAVPMRAPINQFAHARSYPGANERDVVRFNFDTLYSLAWVDVSKEPVILSVPDTAGRYYLLEMLDMWSDVFSVVGKRTTNGNGPGNFALVPTGWSGTLPEGMTKIVAPTPLQTEAEVALEEPLHSPMVEEPIRWSATGLPCGTRLGAVAHCGEACRSVQPGLAGGGVSVRTSTLLPSARSTGGWRMT
jgi:hypothetical protein